MINKRMYFLIVLFAMLSCDQKECNLTTDLDLGDSKEPTFFVKEHVEGCTYEANVDFWVENTHIVSVAHIKKQNEAIHVKLLKPETTFFKLFDFQSKIGSTYSVSIPYVNGKTGEVNIQLGMVYKDHGNDVYKYVILKGYKYLDNWLDQVVFIDENRGFIGSYFKDTMEDNYIIAPAGNILRDVIDYSSMETRLLK